jgi:hypothetical protein
VIDTSFDDFVLSLVQNGEKSGWTSQNATSGAYGKFQILPINWHNWAPPALSNVHHPWIWAQILLGRAIVADKVTPPAEWWPNPTETNQTVTACWRLAQMWANHAGNAQVVAAMWNSGISDPTAWDARVIKYVNRVCVPLGYDAIPVPV